MAYKNSIQRQTNCHARQRLLMVLCSCLPPNHGEQAWGSLTCVAVKVGEQQLQESKKDKHKKGGGMVVSGGAF